MCWRSWEGRKYKTLGCWFRQKREIWKRKNKPNPETSTTLGGKISVWVQNQKFLRGCLYFCKLDIKGLNQTRECCPHIKTNGLCYGPAFVFICLQLHVADVLQCYLSVFSFFDTSPGKNINCYANLIFPPSLIRLFLIFCARIKTFSRSAWLPLSIKGWHLSLPCSV